MQSRKGYKETSPLKKKKKLKFKLNQLAWFEQDIAANYADGWVMKAIP